MMPIAFTFRQLLKFPGVTIITLLVFAIGIGAATAIASVADALFMRPLPVAQPQRLMTVWQYNRETGLRGEDVAPGNAIDWIARSRTFEAAAIAEAMTFNLNFAGREPDYLMAARVSDQFFKVLGTSPLHGRTFLAEEYRRGAPRVVLLSHAAWTGRFGGDPSIVGRTVRLDTNEAFTVVGVMPAGLELRLFHDSAGARRPETSIWLPKQDFTDAERNNRGGGFWNVIGRLRPGVSVDQAQAELDLVAAQLARDYPRTNARVGAEVVPLRSHLAGSMRDVLPLLLGAAAILLIVACANVANLLLARGAARGQEFAIRQALGASRARLLRQMLGESLLLATVGGAIGLVLARWTLDVFARLRPRDVGLLDRIPIDARAAAIACAVTLLAAVVAGLAPSLQLSRPAAATMLRERRPTSSRRTRAVLVVVEVAAALLLAVGAGLLVRSFVAIQRVDPGFSRDNVSVLQLFVSARIQEIPRRIVFFDQVLDRMRALPGVVAAGAVSSLPFGEARVIVRAPLVVAGRPAAGQEQSLAYMSAVSGDYFKAMDVELAAGRLFGSGDTADSQQVVLVSRSAARQFWHGEDPIGSKVQFRFSGKAFDAEVVGIVGDVRHEALDRPAAAEVFVPYSQLGFHTLTFVVRTAPGSPANPAVLKEQVWSIDPLQSIYNTETLERLIGKTLAERRFNLFVIAGFALAALLLATAGVYGVISFSTSQRTREFGVRMALGAARRDIMQLVLREGLTLAGIGLAIGIAASLPGARLWRSLLFGVSATDPLTLAAVGLLLLLVSTAACYLPAKRALEVDPVRSLRFE
jgi:putative ABC transport system permease protein